MLVFEVVIILCRDWKEIRGWIRWDNGICWRFVMVYKCDVDGGREN